MAGLLGGAVVLGMWMFLSSLAILLGAELNAELEHQTEEDSTVGPPRPMGQRAARMADDLGEARPQSTGSSGTPAYSSPRRQIKSLAMRLSTTLGAYRWPVPATDRALSGTVAACSSTWSVTRSPRRHSPAWPMVLAR